MIIKTKLSFLLLSLLFTFNSCCIGAKEDYLGNNIYLSEYNNIDRRILYQKGEYAPTSVEIIPMTVLEMAHNSEWILAKTGTRFEKNNFKYWLVKNNYENIPDSETVIKNTTKFNDYDLFKLYLVENNIKLELEIIE